jgi:hypothetical protein
MNNIELALLVAASYLFFLWFYGRLRILRGRETAPSLLLFRRLDRMGILRELAEADGTVRSLWARILDGDRAPDDSDIEAIAGDWRPLTRSLVWALEAERAPTALARYDAAARSRGEARKAHKFPRGALREYLEIHVALAFLTDPLNLEWILVTSRLAIGRALALYGPHPLLHLLAAHRFSLAGEAEECLAALARAFFHARDDRYIAELIVAAPAVADRSPALLAEAQRALAGSPPAVQ